MVESKVPDYYEVLQISPRADRETIERVFRHLAKRYHPDNAASGDADQFTRVVEAFRVLSDPEQRATYDVRYEALRQEQWHIFDQGTAQDDIEMDRRLRIGILSILYTARRNDPANPGVGVIELERLLGCPEAHMQFHVWYLRENGLVQRLETGLLAITAKGVDRAIELGGPARNGVFMLHAGESGEANESAA